MKKSLLALAVLSAFAGAASAQSSVTLSGIVDMGVQVRGSDWTMGGSQSAYQSINIAGREDLGGGLSAFFQLNHRFQLNTGRVNTSSANPGTTSGDVFWRQTVVGLASSFGDIRLGRMLMPLQDVNGRYDAFDTGYVGSTHTGGLTATVRANNQIHYRSPAVAGFQLQAAIAAAEAQTIFDTQGNFGGGAAGYQIPNALLNNERPMGVSLAWTAGPFSIAAAYDKNTADYDTAGIYGSWDIGFMKLLGQFEKGEINNAAGTAHEDVDVWSVSARFPVGAFVFKAGYVSVDSDRANGDLYKYGLGGEYFLSKRTSLYSNVGQAKGDRPTGTQDDVRWDIGITHKF